MSRGCENRTRQADPKACSLTPVSWPADPHVSDLALVGPVEKCKETLAKYVSAGADMPIITPNPVGKQSPLEVMEKIIEVIK